jgi:hypothetical protein
MNWIKILGWSIIAVLILMIAPIPLAALVDMTFHWLLLVTLPVGIVIITVLAIVRQYMIEKKKKQAVVKVK